jgi:hypothetical protein
MRYRVIKKAFPHKKLEKVELDLEVQQADTPDDAIAMCGGDVGFLSFFNSTWINRATQGTRQAITKDESEDKDAFGSKAAQYAALTKNYSPEQAGGPSKKDKVELVDSLLTADPATLNMSVEEFLKSRGLL